MNHLLDNMIWHAITTGNSNLALLNGEAGCYKADIAPFAAVKENTAENFGKLHAFLEPGWKVAISYFDEPVINNVNWQLLKAMDCCQMVYEYPVQRFDTKESWRLIHLGQEHIPQMLELTALTKPGPFLQHTIQFGNYFGVIIDGRLAAMAGQRMHPVPYMEVSAVCTHPDFRGKGYAKACMLRVMELIVQNGFTPFLHVLADNITAIQLYESIGFRVRRKIWISMVKRV